MTRQSLLAVTAVLLALAVPAAPAFALNPQPLPPKQAYAVKQSRVSIVTSHGSTVTINPQPLPPRQSGLRGVAGR